MDSNWFPRLGRFAVFCVVLGLLAGMLAHISSSLHPRFLGLPDSVDSQKAILEHRPFVFSGYVGDFTSWRSRILVPHTIKFLSALTGIRFGQSYVVVRLLSALFALAAFACLAARHVGRNYWTAGLAAALLSLLLLPTFLHIYDIPTDFPDAGFFAVLVLFALEKRRALFVVMLFVALLNRESALFSLWVWLAVHAVPFDRRRTLLEMGFCGGIGLLGVALVAWLRVRFAAEWNQTASGAAAAAAQPVPMIAVHLRQLRDFFGHPYWGDALYFLFGYLFFFCTILAANWRALPPLMRRLALVAGGILIFSVPFANLPELRVYIPAIVLSTFVLLAVLTTRIRHSAAAS